MYKDMSTSTPGRTRPLKLAAFAVVFVVVCLLFFVAFDNFQPDQKSLSDLYFPSPTATFTLTPTPTSTPTSTPSPTPTPYVYLTPQTGIVIHEETFDTNSKAWDAYYKANVVRVANGKLILRSNEKGQEGMALCRDCVSSTDNFYFQAELLPEKPIAIRYGISFCASENSNEYYVFAIDEVFSLYTLYKLSPANQQTLINSVRTEYIRERTEYIYRYPIPNTLGVKFAGGTMDLYLNGHKLNSYTDKNPLTCKWPGVFVEDGIFILYVDNIFSYNVK